MGDNITLTQFLLGLVALLIVGTFANVAFAPDAVVPEVTVQAPPIDYDVLATNVASRIVIPEVPTDGDVDTITTRRDAHENECLILAEEELESTSFLKDLADEADIDDWRDIDDVTYRDYDVSGFSRSDVRNEDCSVTLEKVRVFYDGDELEKGELTFTIEDGEVDDDETEFDF